MMVNKLRLKRTTLNKHKKTSGKRSLVFGLGAIIGLSAIILSTLLNTQGTD